MINFYLVICFSVEFILGIRDGCGLLYWFMLVKMVIRWKLLFGFLIKNEGLMYFIVIFMFLGCFNILKFLSLLNFCWRMLSWLFEYLGICFFCWGGCIGLFILVLRIFVVFEVWIENIVKFVEKDFEFSFLVVIEYVVWIYLNKIRMVVMGYGD